MADLTDEDLDAKREYNSQLREAIAEAEATAAETLRAKNREIEGAMLDAEAKRLEAQLQAAVSAAQSASQTESSGPLAQVTQQLQAATVTPTPQTNTPPPLPADASSSSATTDSNTPASTSTDAAKPKE